MRRQAAAHALCRVRGPGARGRGHEHPFHGPLCRRLLRQGGDPPRLGPFRLGRGRRDRGYGVAPARSLPRIHEPARGRFGAAAPAPGHGHGIRLSHPGGPRRALAPRRRGRGAVRLRLRLPLPQNPRALGAFRHGRGRRAARFRLAHPAGDAFLPAGPQEDPAHPVRGLFQHHALAAARGAALCDPFCPGRGRPRRRGPAKAGRRRGRARDAGLRFAVSGRGAYAPVRPGARHPAADPQADAHRPG
ncbi:hypothetical protein DSECCO2_620440 [anaerobic digester metagenome]